MQNLIIATFIAAEGKFDSLEEILKQSLPDTRAFDGCLQLDVYQEEGTNIPLILSIILSCVTVGLIGTSFFVFRHFKEEAKLAQMHWKVEPHEILPTKEPRGRFGSKAGSSRVGGASNDSFIVERTA